MLYHKLSELQLGAVAWVSKPQMLPSSRKASEGFLLGGNSSSVPACLPCFLCPQEMPSPALLCLLCTFSC